MEKAAAFFTRQIMPLDEFNTFSTGGAISYLFLQKDSCALDFWGVMRGIGWIFHIYFKVAPWNTNPRCIKSNGMKTSR